MMRFAPAFLWLLAVVADAERLGSTSKRLDEGVEMVGSPIEFDAPELKVYDRVLETSKSRNGSDERENYRVLEGNNIFGDERPDGRKLQGCPAGAQLWYFELTTDDYAFETSWELKKGDVVMIAGPPANTRYQDDTAYSGQTCLAFDTYSLIVHDSQRDGLCCSYGEGGYQSTVDGVPIAVSPGDVEFEVLSYPFVIGNNDNDVPEGDCNEVTIRLKVDEWPKETSYELTSVSSGDVVMSSIRENEAHELIEKTECLPPGDYRLNVSDDWGGIYQHGSRDGFYDLSVNGVRIVYGDRFNVRFATHLVRVGYVPPMTARDQEWLESHNTRRLQWHGQDEYVPLKWSPTLAADAKTWAEHLVDNCDRGPWHEPGIDQGENLAGNHGSGSWGWLRTTEQVMTRFVENEAQLGWPGNAHLTQALWKASEYVGCADSERDLGNGRTCHRQVCRYKRPGNCQMSSGHWRDLMLQDVSRCGTPCPVDGCYA